MKPQRVQWKSPSGAGFDGVVKTAEEVWAQVEAAMRTSEAVVVHVFSDGVADGEQGSLRLLIGYGGFVAHYEHDLDPPYFWSAGEDSGDELLFWCDDQTTASRGGRLMPVERLRPLVDEYLSAPGALPRTVDWEEV